jgi:hypothetical protein
MRVEKLEAAIAKAVLGLNFREDLPSIAVSALESGLDSPSLRVLAGLTPLDLDDAWTLFEGALSELQMPAMSQREAAELLAREAAKELLRGAISPYEGAKGIWRLSLLLSGEDLSTFDPFIYAASEWEDRPEDRSEFDKEIREAAKVLLAQ